MNMPMDRRGFLSQTTFAAGLAALTLGKPSLVSAIELETPKLPDLSKWADVRSQFPALTKDFTHLSGFYLVSHPTPVRQAIEAARKVIDSNPFLEIEHGLFDSSKEIIPTAMRKGMAPYLGAKPEEIAITTSTTVSLAMVYAGLRLKTGDEVITGTQDHFSQHESIRFACEKAGANMRKFSLYSDPSKVTIDEITKNLVAAIRPETRVVGTTWVHSGTGVKLPIRALADVIAKVNRGRGADDRILFVVDGAHGFGVVDENVADLGCDFFCAGTHKWMFAPRGTGIIWARAESWAHLRPTIPSFDSWPRWDAWMEGKVSSSPVTALDITPGGFQAFEHQWAMVSAFKFHEAIGRSRVEKRIEELNSHCKGQLASIPKVRIITPLNPTLSAGITCFEVTGMKAEDVGKKLAERKIGAGPSPYIPSYLRFAPGLINTIEDVDRGVQAVREIAS